MRSNKMVPLLMMVQGMSSNGSQEQRLLNLFQLEKEIRQADHIRGLSYVLVNRLRSLVAFQQGCLFLYSGQGRARVEMVSDVAKVDPNAPYVRWLTACAGHLKKAQKDRTLAPVGEGDLGEKERKNWPEWGAKQVFWVPLIAPGGRLVGALWLTRQQPFPEEDRVFLEKIAEVAAHAIQALSPRNSARWPVSSTRKYIAGGTLGLLLVLAMLFPVSQSVLAPAQVIARNPSVIAAPMSGVIETVEVDPNSTVHEGQVLLRYEDTDLRGQLAIAREEFLVAQTELLSASQAAFGDVRIKGKIATLKNRLKLQQVKLDFTRQQVDKIKLRAPMNGVAVFQDKADLVGVPVKTGQRLMHIADPKDTQLQIDLPVGDAIFFERGAKVRLFLDKAPLSPLEARLFHSSFEPQMTAQGVMGYRLIARFDKGEGLPRLGLRGMAKISGEDVSLFYYIFRRPLTALRQMVGV